MSAGELVPPDRVPVRSHRFNCHTLWGCDLAPPTFGDDFHRYRTSAGSKSQAHPDNELSQAVIHASPAGQ